MSKPYEKTSTSFEALSQFPSMEAFMRLKPLTMCLASLGVMTLGLAQAAQPQVVNVGESATKATSAVTHTSAQEVTQAEGTAEPDDTEALEDIPSRLVDMPPVNSPEYGPWEKKLIESKDTAAIIELGNLYVAGTDVPLNETKGAQLFEKAVELGDASAYYELALLYEGQEGQDAKVLHYTRLGAEHGQVNCQYNLAVAYDEGLYGLKRNLKDAILWYRKAAEQDFFDAQLRLGEMLYLGQGTKKNPQEAMSWFIPLAQEGYMMAQFYLGQIYRYGQGVPVDMKKAIRYFEEAANSSSSDAEMALGEIYSRGEGVPRDLKQAADWYSTACEDGHQQACVKLNQLKKAK